MKLRSCEPYLDPIVVCFAFNRPREFSRVLSSLKCEKVERLVVFVDGPRNTNEAELVKKCCQLAHSCQDWSHVECHSYEHNNGISGIIDRIDCVFNQYKTAIIIEDDCLPMPGFIRYTREALLNYELNHKVFAIGGYQYAKKSFFGAAKSSVVATSRFTSWGWGTWRDRWQEFRTIDHKLFDIIDTRQIDLAKAGIDLDKAANRLRDGQAETYSTRLAIAMLAMEKVMLLPIKGKIANIGLGSGVHGGKGGGDFHPLLNQNLSVERESFVWPSSLSEFSHFEEEVKRIVSRLVRPGLFDQYAIALMRGLNLPTLSLSNLRKIYRAGMHAM